MLRLWAPVWYYLSMVPPQWGKGRPREACYQIGMGNGKVYNHIHQQMKFGQARIFSSSSRIALGEGFVLKSHAYLSLPEKAFSVPAPPYSAGTHWIRPSSDPNPGPAFPLPAWHRDALTGSVDPGAPFLTPSDMLAVPGYRGDWEPQRLCFPSRTVDQPLRTLPVPQAPQRSSRVQYNKQTDARFFFLKGD